MRLAMRPEPEAAAPAAGHAAPGGLAAPRGLTAVGPAADVRGELGTPALAAAPAGRAVGAAGAPGALAGAALARRGRP